MTQRTTPALLTGLATATRGQIKTFTGSDIPLHGGQGALASLLDGLRLLPDELLFRSHEGDRAPWLSAAQVAELTDLYHRAWFKRTRLPQN